jgi:hypothetical protein
MRHVNTRFNTSKLYKTVESGPRGQVSAGRAERTLATASFTLTSMG